MKSMLAKLMSTLMLFGALALAQSGDAMKQDEMKHDDSMKHEDSMKHDDSMKKDDSMKRDDMKQDTMKSEKMSPKTITLSGKVGDDGKTFVADRDAKSWKVSNPDALKGHEGHHVKVKAHVDADKDEIQVGSVKMIKGDEMEKKKDMK